MFNLLRHQLVKSVLRTKLRVGLPSRLPRQPPGPRFLGGTPCRPQKPQPPRPGHPTTNNTAQRLSDSEVDKPAICSHNPPLEARGSGKSIDIHDIGGFDPKDYDVLISDIGVDQLKHQIADLAGIPYHLPATEHEANTVVKIGQCFIYGRNLRTMFPAVVANPFGKAYWVVFLVDTGSPGTYLSAQTSDLLTIPAIREDTPAHVQIAGRQHRIFRAPQHSRFADINILGADFLDAHGISLVYNPKGQEGRLFFDGEAWRVLVEGEKL